jgi:hypothetical protein
MHLEHPGRQIRWRRRLNSFQPAGLTVVAASNSGCLDCHQRWKNGHKPWNQRPLPDEQDLKTI